MSLSRFIQFNEGVMRNKAFLVFEAFVDNILDSHYKKTDSSITFNVGKTAKLSRFSGLDFVIRTTNNSAVRLAKKKEGNGFAIVVDVKQLPAIQDLDDFLNKKSLANKIVEELEKYIEINSDNVSDNEVSKLTDYEKSKLFNSREKFEETYQKLVSEFNKKIQDLEKLVSNFEKEIEETGNPSRRATLEMAIEKLKKDYLGSSYKDFTKIAYELLEEIEPQFKEHIDKDNKKLLDSRLKQFYQELT